MVDDDLTRPLGLPRPRTGKRRGILIYLLPAIVIGAGAAFAVAHFVAPPVPAVVARIAGTDPTVTGAIPKAPSPNPKEPGLSPVRPSGELSPVSGDVVIHDPTAAPPIKLAALPRSDLLEPGNYGSIPRISDDGTRPLEAYKRPADPAAGGMYRVAIVVGGVGLSDDDPPSLAALPGAVTLAIAPYGKDLVKTVADARAAGHELLLQLPLEPFGYPDVNPGPKTLTTDAPPAQNIDRLHWLMSRLTTYVGVVNYMGGRFTADAAKLAPVLGEIGKRGLLYLDDGSSPRSQAAAAAGATPFLQADVVLDADTDPAAIDQRLADLSALARQRGYAIATGSAFPATIDRIAAFAKDAASHGIAIVPVTALLPART